MISPISLIKLKESFRAKVFSLCILFIVIVSFSFTIFFILHESNIYEEQLLSEGNLLASLLAYNSRLAVFAENRESLQAAAEGITKNKNVSSVTIFAANGEMLTEVNKGGSVIDPQLKSAEETKRIRALLGDKKSSSSSQNKNNIAFYSQIITEIVYPSTESLYFKEKTKPPEFQAIGLVRIVLEKADLKRRIGNLLLVGFLFLALFLFLGIAGVYKVLRWITEPLNSLMEGVQTVGKGDLSRRVPIETADEIGKVAVAFNTMAETLERRDAEKTYLEEQLRIAQKMEAKAEWERTFDTVTDLIAIIDREQRIVQVNEAMAQRFGITKGEAAGKNCFELFHAKNSADAGCPCLRLLKDGREHETEIY
jgi:nitrogen fixation/metabolism regulation signal transduction histidine kinase